MAEWLLYLFICCKGSNYFWDRQIKSRFILNKMYFYYFLAFKHPFLRRFYESFPRAKRFRVFRVIRSFKNLTQERSAQSVKSDVSIFSLFRYDSTLSNSTCAHGAQFNAQHSTLNIHTVAHPGIEPGATPCRGGRCAARYPHGLQQPAKKILRLWLVFPPMELNHRKAMPGAGWSRAIVCTRHCCVS